MAESGNGPTQGASKPKTKAQTKAKAHTVRKPKATATSGAEAGQLDRIPAKLPRW